MKKALLLLLLTTFIALTGCKRENKVELESITTTEIQTLNTSSDATNTEIEEYSNETHIDKPDVEDVLLIDKTNSLTDEELDMKADEFNTQFSSFTKEVFNFTGLDDSYINRLNSYYTSKEIFPNATLEDTDNIYKTFLLNSMRSEYIDTTYANIEFNKSFNTNLNCDVWVVRTKGYITSKSSTKDFAEDNYHTLFSAAVACVDGNWQIVSFSLAQVFKGDILMEWQNPNNYENIAVTGEFVYNSEIGIFTEEDEIAINNILNSQQ